MSVPPEQYQAARVQAQRIANGEPVQNSDSSIIDTNDIWKIWHTTAILIGVFGVIGGIVMTARAIQTVSAEIDEAKDKFVWWDPTTWSLMAAL